MNTRKSARLISRAEAALSIQSSLQTTSNGPEAQLRKKKVSQSAGKNASVRDRTDYNKVKGKRGHLGMMTEMPVDILLEIFCQLEPIDLLHLSRASKSLRRLLLANNIVYIWKLAYENILFSSRPPLCPDGVNIIYYTDFLYGRHCQFCASIYGRISHDTALVRLCSKCVGFHLIRLYKLASNYDVTQICNSWNLPMFSGSHMLAVEYKRREQGLLQAKNENRAETYIQECKSVIAHRNCHAAALRKWRDRVATSKDKVYHERELAITKKLTDEGYGNIDTYNICLIPAVRKCRALTDFEWSCIRADVIDYLQDEQETGKERIILNELKCVIKSLNDFIYQMSSDRPFVGPTGLQIASLDPFFSLIKANPSKTSICVELERLKPQLLAMLASWREDTDRYLVGLVSHSSSKGKEKEKSLTRILELATTFFKCYKCKEPISYPRVLMHKCLMHADESDVEEQSADAEDDTSEKAEQGSMVVQGNFDRKAPRKPRPPRDITADTVWPSLSTHFPVGMHAGKRGVSFDEEAHNVARTIVEVCGEDADGISYIKMQEKDARLECLRCSRARQGKSRSRLVMSWTTAILHDLEEHYEETPSTEPSWRMIDSSEDIAKIQETESKMTKKWKSPKYCCIHCGQQLQQPLLWHLRTHNMHMKASQVLKHCYPDVDSPMKMPPYAVKL